MFQVTYDATHMFQCNQALNEEFQANLFLLSVTGFQVDLACVVIFAVCIVYTTIVCWWIHFNFCLHEKVNVSLCF